MKCVSGTTMSSCYGCSLAIANPLILPEYAFCIMHRDVMSNDITMIQLQDYQK